MIDGNRLQVCALFKINIGLTDSLTFTPDCAEILSALKFSIESIVEAIKTYKPFLKQDKFEKYAEVAKRDEEVFNDKRDMISIALGE